MPSVFYQGFLNDRLVVIGETETERSGRSPARHGGEATPPFIISDQIEAGLREIPGWRVRVHRRVRASADAAQDSALEG